MYAVQFECAFLKLQNIEKKILTINLQPQTYLCRRYEGKVSSQRFLFTLAFLLGLLIPIYLQGKARRSHLPNTG